MQRATCAANGPNHLGLCARQELERPESAPTVRTLVAEIPSIATFRRAERAEEDPGQLSLSARTHIAGALRQAAGSVGGGALERPTAHAAADNGEKPRRGRRRQAVDLRRVDPRVVQVLTTRTILQKMALITSNCGATRYLCSKWP